MLSMLISIPGMLLVIGAYLLIFVSKHRFWMDSAGIIGVMMVIMGFASFYQLNEVKIPSIIAQADTRVEQFTDYDEISDQFTDTYDMTVHELNNAKEIRYYDKATAHDPEFRLLSGGHYTTYYYRVKPDLSYERIPLDETSFDKNRN